MRSGNWLTVALGLSIALGLQAPGAYAQTGKETIEKLVSIFSDWSGNPSDKQTYAEVAKYIDYEGMSQRALGGQWSKLSATQRRHFTNSLRALIEDRYYVRWHKIFHRGKLTFVGDSSASGDTVVKTTLLIGKKVDNLSWRLDMKDGAPKVVSLGVRDVDLLKKLSGRLQAKLSRAGYPGLIAWMQHHAAVDSSSSTAALDDQTK